MWTSFFPTATNIALIYYKNIILECWTYSSIFKGSVWTTESLSKVCSRKTRFIQFNSSIFNSDIPCVSIFFALCWNLWTIFVQKRFKAFLRRTFYQTNADYSLEKKILSMRSSNELCATFWMNVGEACVGYTEDCWTVYLLCLVTCVRLYNPYTCKKRV